MGRGFHANALDQFLGARIGHQLSPLSYAHATLVALTWAFDIHNYLYEKERTHETDTAVARNGMKEAVKQLKHSFDRLAKYDPFLVQSGVVLLSKILVAATRCLRLQGNSDEFKSMRKVCSDSCSYL